MQSQKFWSKFHRKFHFSIEINGICFDYKGDEIIWLFPWMRKNKQKKYYSISFRSLFKNLKEIDKLWNEYDEAIDGENI